MDSDLNGRPTARAAAAVFAGHLHIDAAPDGLGRTVIARQSFRAPFHIGKGYWDGHALQVRVVNPTAGILAGDALELDVAVASGAALLVNAPAATRVFMMKGGAASCRQRFRVAARGWLEYAPEPLFPHGGAEFEQSTQIEVDADGECCFTEALAPGRAGRGETWAWRRLRLGLDLIVGGVPLLRERLDASGPEMGRQAAFHAMPEAWFATVLLVSPALADENPLWPRIRSL
ncbi:MAG: urease accessory protein UreD, partial [Opitutaceae bacterium]